jgi:hypothetical protein
MGLHSKIAEVSAAISHVEKKGRNDFHKYDYAQAADVYAAVRDEFSQRGVTVIPAITSVEITEMGKNKMISAAMEITLTDSESGEQMVVPWHGVGEDTGDKAIYKALTGSLKYFYIQLLSLPTGDDPEDDAHDRAKAKQPAGPSKSKITEVANIRSAELTNYGRNDLSLTDAEIAGAMKESGIKSREDLVNAADLNDKTPFDKAKKALDDAALKLGAQ